MSNEKREPLVLFDESKGEPESLEQAVQVAVGAASACWENLDGAGEFQSERALEVSDQLIAWLQKVIVNDTLSEALLPQYRRAIDKNRLKINELEAEVERQKQRATEAWNEAAELAGKLQIERQAAQAHDSEWVDVVPARPAQLRRALGAISKEYRRAKAKHGDKCIDGPGYTDHQRLAILVEEGGEVSNEVFLAAFQTALGRVGHELTYDAGGTVEGGTTGRLLTELTQVGAMVAGWMAALWPSEAANADLAGEESVLCAQAPIADPGAAQAPLPGLVINGPITPGELWHE